MLEVNRSCNQSNTSDSKGGTDSLNSQNIFSDMSCSPDVFDASLVLSQTLLSVHGLAARGGRWNGDEVGALEYKII